MGGRLNKLVALNVSSVCLLSLGYRSNRVITLGVSSVFLFALGVYFAGSWRRPSAADVNWWTFFYFILEKPATRPRDRCGKEQLVYPFVTGSPGSSRVSALAPYSSGDRVGSTLSTPHAGGDVGLPPNLVPTDANSKISPSFSFFFLISLLGLLEAPGR